MGAYVEVIDEVFNYPMPTLASINETHAAINYYSREEREKYIDIVTKAIATTDKGLHRLCAAFKQEDPRFPSSLAILKWVGEDEEKRKHYAHAKNTQIDLMVEDIIHISDTELDPNRARVRIDARKWVASKLAPKKYGERLEVNHAGNLNLSAMSDQELMRIVQEQTGGPILIESKPVDNPVD